MKKTIMYVGILCWLVNNRLLNTEADYQYARETMWNTYKGAFDREAVEYTLRKAWDTYVEFELED